MVALNPDFSSSLTSDEPVDVARLQVDIAGQTASYSGLFDRMHTIGGATGDGSFGRDIGVDVEPLAIGAIAPQFDSNTLRGSFFGADRFIEASSVPALEEAAEVAQTLERGAQRIPGVEI